MTERGSSQHGPRIDEEMKSETASLVHGAPVESRAEAWRQMEPAGEDEPDPDAIPARDEIEARSVLAMSLRPSAFPGDRARLIGMAQAENATQEVMSWLDRLPADVTFANVQAVWDALGGMHEHRDNVPPAGERVSAETTSAPTDFEAMSATDDFDALPDEAVAGEPIPDEVKPTETPGATEGRSLLETGTTVATEVAGVVLGVAAFAVGAVCESVRAIARRVQGSDG
jgi:hypothetical protein